jgi:hypothetical protein
MNVSGPTAQARAYRKRNVIMRLAALRSGHRRIKILASGGLHGPGAC